MQTDALESGKPSELPLLVAAGMLIVLYMVVKLAIAAGDLPGPVRLARGLLPATAIGLGILAELRLVRRLDELQRRIQLEALAFGYPTALLIFVAIRFLQADGFLAGWELGDVWPFIPFPYALGLWLAVRRYTPTTHANDEEER
ncbi:MAG: hypothetical protein ACE5HP_01255 [Gemmatimonadota bacterium]